jgi:hypothetical protein
MIISEKFPVKKILVVGMLLVLGSLGVKGQKLYADGTITGGILSTGLLMGSPAGLTRTGSNFNFVGSPTTLGIPNDFNSNYYYLGSIKTTSGATSGIGSNLSFLGELETNPALVQANKALSAILLPLAGSNSFIQFRFSLTKNAGTTTYFKLKEKPARNSLVDVAALGVLGLASSSIVVGEVYTGAKLPQNYPGSLLPLVSSSIEQNTGTAVGSTSFPTKTDLLINKDGEWFAAVTPTGSSSYNSARLTAQFPSDLNLLSANNDIKFNVYNAFTEADGNSCSIRPRYTNEGKASGIVSLNTSVLSSALLLNEIVKNPQNAIDNNESSFSSYSSGVANVGLLSSVSQSFYFDHKASAVDGVRIQLGLQNSLVNLDLLKLNGIKFKGYNGVSDIPVFEKGLGELSQLLGLNLLNLITINGTTLKKLDITFKPNIQFDRLEVVFERGLLNVELLGDALRIYEVSLAPNTPTIISQPTSALSSDVCEGTTASFSVSANAPDGITLKYQWQYYDGTSWIDVPDAISSNLSIVNTTLTMNNRIYRVKVSGTTGCVQEVISNNVILLIKPIPTITLGTMPSECKGVTNATLAYNAVTGNPTSYSITWDAPSMIPAVSNLPLPANAIILNVPPTVNAGAYNGYITVKNSSGCLSIPKAFTLVIHPKIASPNLSISSN